MGERIWITLEVMSISGDHQRIRPDAHLRLLLAKRAEVLVAIACMERLLALERGERRLRRVR